MVLELLLLRSHRERLSEGVIFCVGYLGYQSFRMRIFPGGRWSGEERGGGEGGRGEGVYDKMLPVFVFVFGFQVVLTCMYEGIMSMEVVY